MPSNSVKSDAHLDLIMNIYLYPSCFNSSRRTTSHNNISHQSPSAWSHAPITRCHTGASSRNPLTPRSVVLFFCRAREMLFESSPFHPASCTSAFAFCSSGRFLRTCLRIQYNTVKTEWCCVLSYMYLYRIVHNTCCIFAAYTHPRPTDIFRDSL